MNTGRYEIRKALPDDLEFLPVIEQRASEIFLDTPFADEVSQECLSIELLSQQLDAGRLWVAVEDTGHPVGFAVAIMIDGAAHLHEVSVDPDHGKRGLGRKLVEAVCLWAKHTGYPVVTLSTFRDVPWNAPFYEQLGFVQLTDPQLTPGLRKLRDEEKEAGLDISARILMRRSLQ
ncbi:MAG TPA: GNAT family N-acetyltransferase [Pyrinomonadaceae bacterium]|nr:GNAT family N-acetyltransferase [Pyrinomonadaceae bacterium]HMP65214.1 GNAT family N-acetyltransferase [Pyrinomonadaceae bacterium]